jgi:hypothetical protein
MRLRDSRKKSALPRVTALTVVAIRVIAVLTPPYSLITQEAFADGENHDKENGRGNEIPPGYIAIDGELSELQLETGFSPSSNRIADYTIDPQGTLSFGEHFSLLLPQAPGVLKNAESSELPICFDPDCNNDDLVLNIDVVNVDDQEFLYVEAYLNEVPDSLGDGFTANEVGFPIYMW